MGSELENPGFEGSALFSQGFRPFFLFGSVFTAVAVLFWVPAFEGRQELLTVFLPVDWHIHEMLFGYLPAVLTGFLLTAIPNWTGRLPIRGRSLILLFSLWVAGRLAVMMSGFIGVYVTAIIDCSFLAVVAFMAGWEIVAGRNWRNLKILVPILTLLVANILFHYEVSTEGQADYARRLGLSAALILIMLIGGRIIPEFTRNWLVRENPGRLPLPFNGSDLSIVLLSIIALILWIAKPAETITGISLLFAGCLNVFRLGGWAGDRAFKNPLVLFLHLSFLFIPLGFSLIGTSIIWPGIIPQAAGIHAFGAGAIGSMTLSVMTRATLGHTGQPLVAGAGEQAIFVGVVLSTMCRIIGSLDILSSAYLIHISGVIWACTFLGFALLHAPTMLTPRSTET